MILGDPNDRRPLPATHARRPVPARRRAAARRHRARRSAQPRELHRRRAAPPHLCRGRPHRFRDRGPAAQARPADRRRRRHPAAQHGRERADHPRRAARRHDRGAAAAAVAARRLARALGRVGAKVIVTASRIGDFDPCAMAMQVAADIFPIRHVCGFGTRSAGRRDRARRPAARTPTLAGGVAISRIQGARKGQSGGPCRAGDLRRHARRAHCPWRAITPS